MLASNGSFSVADSVPQMPERFFFLNEASRGGQHPRCCYALRGFGSTAKVLAKCKLKYYRTSKCYGQMPVCMEWPGAQPVPHYAGKCPSIRQQNIRPLHRSRLAEACGGHFVACQELLERFNSYAQLWIPSDASWISSDAVTWQNRLQGSIALHDAMTMLHVKKEIQPRQQGLSASTPAEGGGGFVQTACLPSW